MILDWAGCYGKAWLTDIMGRPGTKILSNICKHICEQFFWSPITCSDSAGRMDVLTRTWNETEILRLCGQQREGSISLWKAHHGARIVSRTELSHTTILGAEQTKRTLRIKHSYIIDINHDQINHDQIISPSLLSFLRWFTYNLHRLQDANRAAIFNLAICISNFSR